MPPEVELAQHHVDLTVRYLRSTLGTSEEQTALRRSIKANEAFFDVLIEEWISGRNK